METRNNARQGKYLHLKLDRRIGGALLPVVHLVDMRQERDKRKNFSILSRQLQRSLGERLERGEQSFLFLNRRGTANYIVCKSCGFVFDCPHCSVSLTFHGTTKKLMCHYCNFALPEPMDCPDCRGEVIRFSGFGTQKLEVETRKRFPQARIARLDRDTARKRSTFETMFEQMTAGNIDILIGTQMITKGHDFPNVTLVGVVYADLSLHVPDFRSSERSFQLLTQVAGRAGRGEVPGEVIVRWKLPAALRDRMASRCSAGPSVPARRSNARASALAVRPGGTVSPRASFDSRSIIRASTERGMFVSASATSRFSASSGRPFSRSMRAARRSRSWSPGSVVRASASRMASAASAS